MSTGADPKSMPGTAEFRDGYERTFGDRKPQRGRWVYDQRQQKLVPAHEYIAPEIALTAPVMVDRFYENTVAIDGKTDIGSRKKYREYLKRTGFAHSSDFSPEFCEKQRKAKDAESSKRTRETVARIAYTDPRWKP